MYAIEFEADIRDGAVRIPEAYKSLQARHVRVVILFEKDRDGAELRALSNHSASLVNEWQDAVEDDVWT